MKQSQDLSGQLQRLRIDPQQLRILVDVVSNINGDFPLRGLVRKEDYHRFLHRLYTLAHGIVPTAEHSSSVQARMGIRMSMIGDVVRVLAVLNKRNVKGLGSYTSELVNRRLWKNAYNELDFIVRHVDDIAEVQLSRQTAKGQKKSLDVLTKDGRMVELKVYNWDSGFYSDPQRRQFAIKRNVDQISRYLDQIGERSKFKRVEVRYDDFEHPVAKEFCRDVLKELRKARTRRHSSQSDSDNKADTDMARVQLLSF